MDMSPLIAVHLTAALGAVAVGPVALWARKAGALRPRLHRAAGYAWVTLMLLTATSAIFIRDYQLPNIAGYTPIHLLIPVVYGMLFFAFWFLAKGNITSHRNTMQRLYIGAAGVAGAFTLLPGRYLGNLVFGQWLGLIPPNYQPPPGTPMIVQILINTPLWVWGLLAALLVLGFSQTRSRTVGLRRIILLPLGLGAFSLYGTISAFGTSPTVLGSWLATAVLLVMVITQLPLPAGARYDSTSRKFQLPGSWVPMVLIMGIFLTKYAVGVSLVLHPELKVHANFSLAIGTLYGVFSGIFAGRSIRLIRLALRPAATPALSSLNT
jgi:uncharacterized membrane protein